MRLAAKQKFWLDVVLFAGFLVLMQPALTGLPMHEWLATAAIAALLVHLLGQWDWIIAVGRRLLARWDRSRLNFALDAALLLAMTTVFVSGYAISHEVLPALGLPTERGFFWRRIHALSAEATLIIVTIHVALHWQWILVTVKRLVAQPALRVRLLIRPLQPERATVEEVQS